MSGIHSSPVRSLETLRERAEAAARATRGDIGRMSPEEIQRLVHELEVHQIELEMQNEELRQARFELARSCDHFSELYDHAPTGYVTIDAEGQVEEANLRAAAMFGVERGGLVGVNFTRLVAHDSQDTYELHRRAVLESDRPQNCELSLRRSDGTEFAARIESVARGGATKQCRSVIADISARKLSEEKLRELNETLEQRVAERTREACLLGAAVSHLAEGVVITTDGLAWPGPEIVFVNPAMCRITGYPAEELVGQTPRMLQGPATDRSVFAKMRSELAAGRSCRIELVNYRKDGRPYPAEIFITPMFDDAGGHTHYVSIHRDLTERKRAEDALIALGRIVEDSINEIYIFDPATLQVLLANRGGRENLGYTMEELRGLTPLDLNPTFDPAAIEALVEPLLAGKVDKIDFETRHRRKDGTIYEAEVTLQMADYRGKSCFIAIALDTTRRRELEQEVVKASEDERQRIAHDLHDDLGSHLTGLKLHIESAFSLIATRLGEPFEGCAPILELIRGAITLTREIACGLRPVGNDPEDLMGALSGMAARTELAAGIVCRLDCPERVLIADSHVANHLFRIAQEATSNAVKHSGATEIHVSLKDTGLAVELSVVDNGRGFQRHADHAGLGLHIMNYRADAMKGLLRIRPIEGGGTSVRCVVPKSVPGA